MQNLFFKQKFFPIFKFNSHFIKVKDKNGSSVVCNAVGEISRGHSGL